MAPEQAAVAEAESLREDVSFADETGGADDVVNDQRLALATCAGSGRTQKAPALSSRRHIQDFIPDQESPLSSWPHGT